MKKIKGGTTVWLCCATHDVGSKEWEEYTLTEDMTPSQLEDVAKDFFYNTKEPEWWVEFEEPDGQR